MPIRPIIDLGTLAPSKPFSPLPRRYPVLTEEQSRWYPTGGGGGMHASCIQYYSIC